MVSTAVALAEVASPRLLLGYAVAFLREQRRQTIGAHKMGRADHDEATSILPQARVNLRDPVAIALRDQAAVEFGRPVKRRQQLLLYHGHITGGPGTRQI